MQEKKQSLIPELRFPGFEGEWPIQPLSNFLHEHKTKSDGKCRVHSVSVSKGVVDQVEYLGRSFAASDTSKYNLAKPNDIIYTKSPTGSFPYGIVKMNKKPYNVIVSPLYGVYSPTNKYIGYILDSYFESPERTNTYLSTLIQKGAKNTIQITNSTFISKNVCFPTDEAEQQKIAECLSSVDNLIQAEADQLQALKDHKKGLMQQLFPQEGETTPKLRFPGFEGAWKEKKFGELCKTITPSLKLQSSNYLKAGKYPIVDQSQSLVCGWTNDSKGLISDVPVIIFGDHTCVLKYIDFPFIQGADGVKILSPQKGYDSCFIYQSFLANPVIQDGYKRHFSELKEKTYMFPSLPEQQKIADCLSSLDEGIAVQQRKVEALKEHKKGLMQKLFPAID